MSLDDRARASTREVLASVTRVDPVAGLEDLRRRRRRRRATRVATAVATATALTLVALVVVRGPSPQPSVAQPPGSLGRVTARIPVGAGPVDAVVADGAVWVANAGEDTVSRIDPATDAVTGTTSVGRNPVRLAAGFGSVWVANRTSSSVSRLDARTGRLQATIPVPNNYFLPTQLTLDADAVWVQDEVRLWRLDPATNTMADRTGDWETGGGLAVVDGILWLSGRTRTGAGQIVRADPSTSRVVDRLPTGGDGAIAVGGGSVWVAGINTQTIYRYDPASRRLLAEIPIGAVARGLSVDAGSLWVSSDGGRVTRIDMATDRVAGAFQVGGRAPAAVVGLGSVWIVDTANAALLRFQPTG